MMVPSNLAITDHQPFLFGGNHQKQAIKMITPLSKHTIAQVILTLLIALHIMTKVGLRSDLGQKKDLERKT